MKSTLQLATFALVAIYTSFAFGHGFTVWQQGNNLVLDTQGSSRANRVGYVPPPPTENENSGNPYTFAHAFDMAGGAPHDMSHGSLGLINDAGDELDLADSYLIEFAGPAWYSNGGAAVPSSYSIAASSLSSTALEIDTHVLTGTSPPGTMLVSGHSSHSIVWTLNDLAADGVYGWAYRLLWDDAGGAVDFRKTNWVTVLGFTTGFAGNESLLAAEQAVVAASVPEPSSLALAACAVVAGGVEVLRRRRAARRATVS